MIVVHFGVVMSMNFLSGRVSVVHFRMVVFFCIRIIEFHFAVEGWLVLRLGCRSALRCG